MQKVIEKLSADPSNRAALLEFASMLNQNKNYDLARMLLDKYLKIFYADVDALVLMSRVHRNLDSHRQAIQSLHQAHINEHRPAVAALIQTQANTVIGEYVQRLRSDNKQETVLDLYRWLTQSQPAVAGYRVALAKAYATQKRYIEAIKALHYVRNDYVVGKTARNLINVYYQAHAAAQ